MPAGGLRAEVKGQDGETRGGGEQLHRPITHHEAHGMTGAETGGEPSKGTPSRKRSPLVGCALVLAFAPILLFALFLTCLLWPPRVSVGDVERDVAKHLPIGSSEAEVREYLRERDIAFGDPHPASYSSLLRKEGIESCCVIGAIIRDTGNWLEFGQTDIKLYFIFGEHGSIERFIADEVYTSL
jgi:hypothetical protein